MGRAPDCDLQIVEQRASRYHCKIMPVRGKLFIEDLDSTNGIKFKGKRYRAKKIKMKEGDSFCIGADVFSFTKSYDAYIEATEDLVSGYGKKSQRSMVEQTYTEAINKERERKEKKKGFSLFGFFRRNDN